jgi:hypothetical protein
VPTLPKSTLPDDWSSRLRPSYDPRNEPNASTGQTSSQKETKTHHTKPAPGVGEQAADARTTTDKTSRRLAEGDHACGVPPPKPPGHPPLMDGQRPTHYRAGGHLGGTLPHSRQGSPEVSPRTPFPSPLPARPDAAPEPHPATQPGTRRPHARNHSTGLHHANGTADSTHPPTRSNPASLPRPAVMDLQASGSRPCADHEQERGPCGTFWYLQALAEGRW